ncbi:MAG: carboxypeptidase regulatory-like domain-containing protein [Verrucomicrobia bacterium]|nr:carboxypeptidase regulatory-like domain-containing protein [Verrucomicrobiota bacterium]
MPEWLALRKAARDAAPEQMAERWRTPIDFFGKVVDENENPIAEADVVFIWTDLSADGTSRQAAKSNGDGFFQLSGAKGYDLGVSVSKEGYYPYRDNPRGFTYGDPDGPFHPDVSQPVIFRLRKKGKAEPLVVLKQPGIGKWLTYPLPRDGNPIEISLETGKQTVLGMGDMRVELIAPLGKLDFRLKYDWQVKISVLGGGLVEALEEFPFQAPEQGYKPAMEIIRTANDSRWFDQVEQSYYFRLKSGKFGYVKMLVTANDRAHFGILAYVNPRGSRNLEFDPALELKRSGPE